MKAIAHSVYDTIEHFKKEHPQCSLELFSDGVYKITGFTGRYERGMRLVERQSKWILLYFPFAI